MKARLMIFAAVAGGLVWFVQTASSFEGTVSLPLPSGDDAAEPHLAVNPLNPDNLVVGAANSRGFLRSWSSLDGGAHWSAHAFARSLFGDRRARFTVQGDSVVAFGPDGTAYYAGIGFGLRPKTAGTNVFLGSSTDGGRTFGSLETVHQIERRLPRGVHGPNDVLKIVKSGKLPVDDKDWMAIDQSSGPYRGSVYVAWTRSSRQGQDLLLSFSRDGGTTFAPAHLIARQHPDELGQMAQLAVRPDGTIDLVWVGIRKRSSTLLHSSSRDGGATFTSRQPIARLGRATRGSGYMPTLAVTASGRLLACWLQGTEHTQGQRVFCGSSADGETWSVPRALASNHARGVRETLPAAAAQGERLWVVAYFEHARRTRIVLFRSDDGGGHFRAEHTLAERPFGKRLVCGPERPCPRQMGAWVGDYVGLAATRDHVFAAYVLPERPNGNRTHLGTRAYVSAAAVP